MTTESPDDPKPNPSFSKVTELKQPAKRKRIPMSVPVRKLEVPEMEGWHLHWFLEKNIPRALQAAYEFVDFQELPINSTGLGQDVSEGSADLGDRVRVLSGTNEHSHPEYLVLMKLPEEFWLEDRKKIDELNAARMGSIFRGEKILDSEEHQVSRDDQELRYVKTALFNRPTRKVTKST
jgi:hypothetical protein